MSGLLPIIEQLADARSDQERAGWLLRCPLQILGKYEMTIRNRLHHAGFLAGITYLETELICLRGTRDSHGELVEGPFGARLSAREAMWAIASSSAIAPASGGNVGIPYGRPVKSAQVRRKET